MSQLSESAPATSSEEMPNTSETSRYRYGFRYVLRRLPDGDEVYDCVPLTLDDVLHPQIGDYVLTSDYHNQVCVYLYNVLRARVAHDPTAVVFHDLIIYWDVPDLRQHGPDIAVVAGVKAKRRWESFNVAEEGVRPALIIEVTSPATRRTDMYDKLIEYDRAGVPTYIIIDIVRRKEAIALRLFGYQQSPDGYTVLPPNEQGRLWLEAVGLWLGIEEEQVLLYDSAGHPLGDYTAVAIAQAESEARAAAAAAEARAAQQRILELEAELRRLRGES